MDKERSMLIEELIKCRKTYQALLELSLIPYNNGAKSAKASATMRAEGNELFLREEYDAGSHHAIFAHYCKSIITAPNNFQELAFAYGNRSAFLLHIKRYRECIEDIDKVMKIAMTDDAFKSKLLHRKLECLKKLGLAQHLESFGKTQDYNKFTKNECNNLMEELMKIETHYVDSKTETKAAVILPKTDKPLDYVEIKYNQKYGRHLIAKKDYSPGDIIFVEDLYATIVSPEFKCMNCHYCLKTAWSGIPCDRCDWAIFSSEDCKLKAWNAYHDIECLLISSMTMDSDELMIDVDFTIRLFVLAFKEAGSIEKLKEALAEVDQCNDVLRKGFYDNGQFNSHTLQSIYSLKASSLNSGEMQAILQDIPSLLINMIKFTQVIQNFHPKTVEDLIENEYAMFLGSFLIKLASIKKDYSLTFSAEVLPCAEATCLENCSAHSCSPVGSCLGSLANLINHSCYANANRFFTEDGKIIIYAQHPIKKNSQIFNHYYGHYIFTPLAQRQKSCRSNNFECDCIACIESWPATYAGEPLQICQNLMTSNERHDCQRKLFGECFDVICKCGPGKNYSRMITKEEIQKISKAIAKAFEVLKEPIHLVGFLEGTLNKAYVAVYGLELLSFGQCNKMIERKIN